MDKKEKAKRAVIASTKWHKKNPKKSVIAALKWRKNNLEKVQANKKEWRKKNPLYPLKAKYKHCNFTIDDYILLETKQKSRCAICKKQELKRKLSVDHCHKKNIVRGLLCYNCNFAIGLLKDNPKILQSAIKYLEK